MRNLALLFLLGLSLSVSAQKQFVIKGSFDDNAYNGKTIYLKNLNETFKYNTLDSCQVTGKTFTFKGISPEVPEFGFVIFDEKANYKFKGTMLILEEGEISLDITGKNKLGGTPKNKEFQLFFDKQYVIQEKIEALPEGSQTEFDKILLELGNSMYGYLKENMNNRIGEFLLLDASRVLSATQIEELLASARPQYIDGMMGEHIKQAYLQTAPSFFTDKYIDVKLKDLEGKEIAISDYVGKNKVVLIDFWASWCGPCRKEMPYIVSAYEKYKDKGFEVIGISLDENKAAWKKSSEAFNITWPQMSDLKGWNSKAAEIYKVRSIPMSLLLDESGNIIAHNLRGNDLLLKLEELLK